MPLTEHLAELRRRILISLGAFLAASAAAFFLSPQLVQLLLDPLPTPSLVFLGPMDAVVIRLRLAALGGLLFSSPVLLFQAWRFVSPGLTASERKIGFLLVIFGPIFFALGVVFAYHLLPFALRFLLAMAPQGLEPFLTADRTFAFFANLALAFGLVFQLPLAVLVLSLIGLITAEFLRQKRGYALLGLAVVSALLTPPDVFTMMAMLLPMVLLYELSILLATIFGNRTDRRRC